MHRTSFNHEIKNRNNFIFQSNFFFYFLSVDENELS